MTPFQFLEKTKKKRMNDLFRLLEFPSVSGKSEHKKDMVACARWLVDHLEAIGFRARTYPTGGHPVVFAEYSVNPGLPTVMYYGHYDVQPPEPLELWTSPPFKPVLRKGYIFARGVNDDKGQVFAHVKGLEAVIRTTGTLPINVKMMIEGEEETTSENLPAFLKKNRKMLKSDIAVVSDSAQFDKNTPAVTFGLRGIASVEVYVYGPNRDVHSGTFGGTIANPVNVLCSLVAQLQDKNGKITIPGFYKDTRPLSKWERAQFRKLPFKESTFRKSLGVRNLQGEKGYTTFERAWGRPTLDVNGITGGYQGEGPKTIIPSYASCKITMRLVPDMDPADICRKLEKYLQKLAPASVKVKVDKLGGARGVVVPTDGPWLEAAARAIKAGFKKTPVFMKEGGSIPVVGDFKRILGVDTLLLGLCQSDDNTHSPNERLRVRDFEAGCRMAAALPDELAKGKS